MSNYNLMKHYRLHNGMLYAAWKAEQRRKKIIDAVYMVGILALLAIGYIAVSIV